MSKYAILIIRNSSSYNTYKYNHNKEYTTSLKPQRQKQDYRRHLFQCHKLKKTWRKDKAKRQFNDSYAEFYKWSFQKQYSKIPCSSLTSLCHGHKRSSCHEVGNKENIKITQFGIELKWKIHHYCYWTHRCRLIEDKRIFLEVLYQLNDVSG